MSPRKLGREYLGVSNLKKKKRKKEKKNIWKAGERLSHFKIKRNCKKIK